MTLKAKQLLDEFKEMSRKEIRDGGWYIDYEGVMVNKQEEWLEKVLNEILPN